MASMDPSPLPAQMHASPQIPHKPAARYLIRMDTEYDPGAQTLTVVMEVPGVRREDLSVRLSTCAYNRVRQITVSGVVHPPFKPLVAPLITGQHVSAAAASANELASNVSVRERKYGVCQRTLPVPTELKVRTFPFTSPSFFCFHLPLSVCA